MNDYNFKVLTNIIGGVESGGQQYGKQDYSAYADPYENSPGEHTITLGWAQNYGDEAERLIRMIRDADPEAFKRMDTCEPSIESMLSKNWVAVRWKPNEEQKAVLINLISSKTGRECQDKLFRELMEQFIKDCKADYTSDVKAIMMYCEIRHLGGRKAANRIFDRCAGNFTLSNIMAALAADQKDKSSDNQVGDRRYWSRHVCCFQWIEQYAQEEHELMSDIDRAKILLYQTGLSVMTGYTPTGKQCFVNAGEWYTEPKRGDVVYFYSTAKNRVGHVGIVYKVDFASKIIYTVEGNTSSSEYNENGGCVARHQYSYKYQGGTNRINGFGRPNFDGAGITPDIFVETALSYRGYLEKKSADFLDDFTANAGYNNFTKFQRDIGAGNGDQWCQYYVDAMALYSCQKKGVYMFSVDTVREGSTGADAKLMQTLLKGLDFCGYDAEELSLDGIIGKNSVYALRSFQDSHGLEVDGICGKNTWSALLGV